MSLLWKSLAYRIFFKMPSYKQVMSPRSLLGVQPWTPLSVIKDSIPRNPGFSRLQVCKYIDIPLQHINNLTLLGMNRPPRGHTESLLRKLRARIPDLALRTTFISGFPGAASSFKNKEEGQVILHLEGFLRFSMQKFRQCKHCVIEVMCVPNKRKFEISSARWALYRLTLVDIVIRISL